jgi:hypothetical protein
LNREEATYACSAETNSIVCLADDLLGGETTMAADDLTREYLASQQAFVTALEGLQQEMAGWQAQYSEPSTEADGLFRLMDQVVKLVSLVNTRASALEERISALEKRAERSFLSS